MSDHVHRQAARVALTDRDQALELLAHLVSQIDPKDVLALIPDTAHREILERLAEVTRKDANDGTRLTVRADYFRLRGRWVYETGSETTTAMGGMGGGPLPWDYPSAGGAGGGNGGPQPTPGEYNEVRLFGE